MNESVSATDEGVANALSALQGAQAALVKTPTADQLADLRAEIEAGSNLKESDYTSESWAAYQQAVKDAEALFDNENTSAADVESATTAVKQAREQLAKPTVENPPAGGTGTDGSGSGNGTDGSGNGTAASDGNGAAASATGTGTASGLATTGDVAPVAATGAAAIGAAALAAVARFMRRRTRE